MNKPLRLLIVEDSEDDATLLLRQLRKGGYAVAFERVDTAASLRSALEKPWDLIIADYALPGFSGLAALSIYKEKGLDIPYIIVSGNIGEEIAVGAMKAGAHDYLMKGNLARLLPAVERELRDAEGRRERRRAEKVQAATYKISESASVAENLHELFCSIHNIVGELMPAENFYIALYDQDRSLRTFPYFVDEHEQIPGPSRLGNGLTEYVLRKGKPLLAPKEVFDELVLAGEVEANSLVPVYWLGVPLKTKGKIIGVLAVQSYTEGINFGEEELNILVFVSTQVAMAIARKQAEEALRHSEIRYRNLFENSPISLWEEDFSGIKVYIEQLHQQGITNFKEYFENNPLAVDACMELVNVLDINQTTLKLYEAGSKEELLSNLECILRTETRELFTNELVAIAEKQTEFEGVGVNFKLNGEPIDCVLRWSISPEFQQSLSSIVVSVLDITERKQAEEQIQSQLDRLAGLRTIDMAITASLDLRVTLDVLLDQVTQQLHVDAADILLLNPHTQILAFAAGRGFRGSTINRTNLHLSEAYAGRAALERRLLSIPDLTQYNNLLRTRQLTNENFQAYYCVPLMAKGQIKGVLEVFHRAVLVPDPEWLEFLETLSGQAAIAIDNASLFENLQRSNVELAMAYDATIEGWSRALDLRDKETEGHTERVTDVTLRLASAMGLSEEELVHIRRGALLHDIGKMGISDSILLKPGPLSEEEWTIMRKHPIYAYELLSPITYLRPSLDIPYCHHEKWDGSGYPRGLRSEQIPLAARIFAVVDVWDALRSDRAYRKAWPDEQVCEYILNQSGAHFDPQLVDLFLKFLHNGHRAVSDSMFSAGA